MRKIFVLGALVGVAAAMAIPWQAEAEVRRLFNGRDLSGWQAFLVEPAATRDEVWSVRDGILVCRGEPLGYLYTEGSFESFELVVEWRWAPGKEPGNSGVLLRINGEPRGIPRSIEAQLKSGDAGNVYGFHGMAVDGPAARVRKTPGHELLGDFVAVSRLKAAEKEPGEWNRYEIVLNGARLSVRINGQLVNEASGCETMSGPIGLQSEGGEIHFRRVELKSLE